MNIDCGTEMTANYLYKCFSLAGSQSKIGAICSEIESEWSCYNPIVMSQFLEYKLAQILKCAEGLCGLIQILPGACQFIRWKALRGSPL